MASSSSSSSLSLYSKVLRRLAKLEREGATGISFRRPVTYEDVLRSSSLGRGSWEECHAAAKREVLPWFERDGDDQGTFSLSSLRRLARRYFEEGISASLPPSKQFQKGIDAYIAIVQQSRLQVSSNTTHHGDTGVLVEVWSSGIEDPFGGAAERAERAGRDAYHFAYRCRIENRGKHPVKLLGRSLDTRNSNNVAEKVIPGFQPIYQGSPRKPVSPVIEPGDVFDYASHTTLTTPRGTARLSFAVEVEGTTTDSDSDSDSDLEAGRVPEDEKGADDLANVKRMIREMSSTMKSNPKVLKQVNDIMTSVPREDLKALTKIIGLPEDAMSPDHLPEMVNMAAEAMSMMKEEDIELLAEQALESRVNLGEILPHTLDLLRSGDNGRISVPALPSTKSDIITDGIRVRVESHYVPERSSPRIGQFFFKYDVQITNESTDKTVQLMNRHWVITDAEGRTNEVKGPGVIGEKPVLKPGEAFNYTSFTPLQTASILDLETENVGSMAGSYGMVFWDLSALGSALDFDLAKARSLVVEIGKTATPSRLK
ncbi:ApaG domain-containing protein [Chloropicon primus]|nr:ApaG domain-containing protein [Chloropicon primus]